MRQAVFLILLSTASAALPPPATILANLKAGSSYFTSQPGNEPNGKIGDCSWTRGTFYSGLMYYHNVSGDAAALAVATSWATAHNWTCGGLWQDPNNIACGMAYAALYDLAPQDYKLALAVTMDHSVQRWVGYDWWWVDTLFMGLASMIEYSARTGDPRLADAALREYADTTHGGANASQPGLWDPASNLYWRDHTYINRTEPNGAKVFWARGNGWAIAAHALALKALPAAHAAVPELTARLAAMAGALAAVQGADGMWRAALLDPTMAPNPETTGTSAFTFAMAWGVNNNVRHPPPPAAAQSRRPPRPHALTHIRTHTRAQVLPAATYRPIVEKAWAGLSGIALQPSGLVGWCQPANGQPAPTVANSTSDFCVGLWLLAGSEVYKMASA